MGNQSNCSVVFTLFKVTFLGKVGSDYTGNLNLLDAYVEINVLDLAALFH